VLAGTRAKNQYFHWFRLPDSTRGVPSSAAGIRRTLRTDDAREVAIRPFAGVHGAECDLSRRETGSAGRIEAWHERESMIRQG
jgi:hypothetical protein